MLGNIIKKVFGDKSQRDLKEVQPWSNRSRPNIAKLDALSNNELRQRTVT
jgi:preprotein translocase subunit SecA